MLSNTISGLKTAHCFYTRIKKTGVCSCSPDMKYPAMIIMRWEAEWAPQDDTPACKEFFLSYAECCFQQQVACKR